MEWSESNEYSIVCYTDTRRVYAVFMAIIHSECEVFFLHFCIRRTSITTANALVWVYCYVDCGFPLISEGSLMVRQPSTRSVALQLSFEQFILVLFMVHIFLPANFRDENHSTNYRGSLFTCCSVNFAHWA